MDKICKISTVFLNLINLAAGLAATVIMIFKKDFAVVISLHSLPAFAQLIVNLIMFQAGIVLLMIAINVLVDRPVKEFTYPVIYLIIPVIIGLVGIYFGIVSETIIEKAIIIIGSILYSVLSGVLLYFSTKLIESFNKQK